MLFKQRKLLFRPHYQRGPQSLTTQLDLPQGKKGMCDNSIVYTESNDCIWIRQLKRAKD